MLKGSSIKKNFFSHIYVMGITAMLLSCSDAGLKGRPLIEKFGASGGGEEQTCQALYDLQNGGCLAECRSESHLANQAEREQVLEEVESSSLEEERKRQILANIGSARGLCVAGAGVLRPNNSVFVKGDHCICLDGKPDSLNNCSTFCSKKANPSSTLYGSVNLGEEVVNNPRLGNLKNWCEVELSEDYTGLQCVLEFVGDGGTEQIPLEIPRSSNNFSANLSTLAYETPYVARIVETQTGVSSDTFQIYRKKYPESSSFPPGPLKVVPVSQYTCLSRPGETEDNHEFYTSASKIHFYFPAGRSPPRVSPGNSFLICHDINNSGNQDSPLYDRLELISQHFMIWDEADIRLYDETTNINQQIKKLLLEDYGVKGSDINVFVPFAWPNHPEIKSPPNLGYIMQPWVESSTGKTFCPTHQHYHGDIPIFKILKDFVGVDTEGIYVAERELLSSLDSKGEIVEFPQDIILIRENLLKKIWFYFEDGKYFIPDAVTATQKRIYFYWPPDTKYPYVRKSDQYIYTVKSIENIGKDEKVGLSTTTRTADKRFGCVPVL